MMRAPRGISAAAQAVGVAGAVEALVARADELARRASDGAREMRSPISVWRRMNSHSSSSSGPGLWRIASGIAVLPTSWSSAPWPIACSCSGRPSCAATSPARARRRGRGAEVGLALGQDLQQEVPGLRGRGRPGVLLRVHALVGEAQGRPASGASREARHAVRAADREASPRVLAPRRPAARSSRIRRCRRRARRTRRRPSGRRGRRRGRAPRGARPGGRERVAGGMAEGVVVALEAVEVEEREHDLALVGERLARVAISARRLPRPVRRRRAPHGGCRPAAVRSRGARPAATARACAARRK